MLLAAFNCPRIVANCQAWVEDSIGWAVKLIGNYISVSVGNAFIKVRSALAYKKVMRPALRLFLGKAYILKRSGSTADI